MADRFDATGWISYLWNSRISTSLRLHGQIAGNIDGADPDLNPAMVPTADPNNQGGERVDLFFGLNVLSRESIFKGHRIAIEYGFPIYYSLDGPQMETDHSITLGWQYAF